MPPSPSREYTNFVLRFLSAAPAEGAVAPDFTLPSNRGKDISLTDLLKQAKHTVLYFYPGEMVLLAWIH